MASRQRSDTRPPTQLFWLKITVPEEARRHVPYYGFRRTYYDGKQAELAATRLRRMGIFVDVIPSRPIEWTKEEL